MSDAAYQLVMPDARTTSVIFASPHSGRDYPAAFLRSAVLSAQEIRSSEDAFVDLLYADAPRFGAPLLTANAPRAYLDLNRGPQEMDAGLIEGVRRVSQNPRVASGLGVVPRVVAGGRSIYKGKISLAEAHHRITRFWHPYHAALQALIDESHSGFGQAILIDCHSMPHEALVNIRTGGGARPDVVLGDRFGGPSRKQHAVQIEIDRALYMNEATLEVNDNFAPLRALLSGVMSEITELGRETDTALAAQ